MILRSFYLTFFCAAFLCVGILVGTASSQMRHGDDDTLFFALDAVTVTATRLPTALRDAPAAVDVYPAREIAALPARSLSDLLAISSGASIRDYGGPGSLQLASLRGLGAEYTLVLLDGMRLNGAQNALVDVGQLSLETVDRVEIVRGGLASLYGSNALGGVVNIVTARQRPPLAAGIGYGAFGWRQFSLGAGTKGAAGRAWADFRYEQRANDFGFTPSWGGDELRRQNASMQRRVLSAGGTLLLRDATLTLRADLSEIDAGTPGAVFSPAQGRARQNDRQALVTAQLDAQLTGRSQLRASAGLRLARQEYRDPDYRIGDKTLHSRYDQSQFFASALFEQEFDGGHRALIGLETSTENLRSEDLPLHPLRTQGALFASGDLHFRLAGLPLRLYPALRLDVFADALDGETRAGTGETRAGTGETRAGTGETRAGSIDDETTTQVSPSLGLHLGLMPGRLAFRARFARAFAMPTFNQLYWREGGNPALRPEYSTSFDAGFVHTAGAGQAVTEVTVFHHDVTDKIVWAPSSGLYWTPRNVQHVRSTGVEAQLQLQWGPIALRANGQWISSRKANSSFAGDATTNKQLIYVPEWSGALTVAVPTSSWSDAGITTRVLGQRYYDESNTVALPAHIVVDLAVTARVSMQDVSTTWKLELLNAFDASYEVIAFYPMPGRHLRLTLGASLQ